MGNVKFIKDLLYRMRRDYGLPATYFVAQKSEFDENTGIVNLIKTPHNIKKLIRLPVDTVRRVIQDIAYLAANKNFTYGAAFDDLSTIVIISPSELPRDVLVNTNDWLVFDGRRYTIKKFSSLEHNCGWVLQLEAVEGSLPFRVIQQKVYSSCNIQQGVILT